MAPVQEEYVVEEELNRRVYNTSYTCTCRCARIPGGQLLKGALGCMYSC